MIGKTIARYQKVATAFKESEWPVVKVALGQAGHRRIRNLEFLVSKTRFPIVGNNIIFEQDYVALSTEGIHYGLFNSEASPLATFPLITSFRNGSPSSGVKSLFFVLNIDGRDQRVFFDTGRAELLTGTAKLARSKPRGMRRFDFRFNTVGHWGLSTYSKAKATLQIGSQDFEYEYCHLLNEKSVDAPFIMGASILDQFDIAMSISERRATFFPKGSFS